MMGLSEKKKPAEAGWWTSPERAEKSPLKAGRVETQ
jgi:hypothetical protein